MCTPSRRSRCSRRGSTWPARSRWPARWPMPAPCGTPPARPEQDVRLVQLPALSRHRARLGADPGRCARARSIMCGRTTSKAGAGRTRRCSGGSRRARPAPAPTAISTRTSSTWPAFSPARKWCRWTARWRGRSSPAQDSGLAEDRPEHGRRCDAVPRDLVGRRGRELRVLPRRHRPPQRQHHRAERRAGQRAVLPSRT